MKKRSIRGWFLRAAWAAEDVGFVVGVLAFEVGFVMVGSSGAEGVRWKSGICSGWESGV